MGNWKHKSAGAALWCMAVWPCAIPLAAGDTVQVPMDRYGYDQDLGLLVVAMPGEEVQQLWGGVKDAVYAGTLFTFLQPVDVVATGLAYEAEDAEGRPVKIYFTDLPLVSINAEESIVDEPKVPAVFNMWSSGQVVQGYDIGIEYRGGSSQALPKKSFLIEFRQPGDLDSTMNVELLGMRSDDDWNLQALAVEPLRLRSVVAQEIWMDMHQPYYLFLEPQALSGVRHKYVELFVNDAYRGLYALGERVDRKQLQLKPFADDFRGELFKGVAWGASTFTSSPVLWDPGVEYWGGFHNIYPKDNPDWVTLKEFVDLVVTGSDEDFFDQVDQWFYRPNAIDYFLFLNVLKAVDNTGKNIFLARYNEHEPYFYVPWDLDGILGLSWDGSHDTTVLWFLSNGLYDRWIEDLTWRGFRYDHCERWKELRQTVFTVDNIMPYFQEVHARLAASGVYRREELAWPGYHYDPGELGYLEQWLAERLAFLDMGMAQTCATVGVQEFTRTTALRTYPNPSSYMVTAEWSVESGPVDLCLLNAVGQRVLAYSCTGTRVTMDVSQLAPGLYQIRVEQHGLVLARSSVVVQ